MGQHDPRIDAYIDTAAEFARPILQHLRQQVHAACPQAEETLKWGAPSFSYRGRILCGMAAFKEHATFAIWQRDAVAAEARVEGAMGQFGRLTRLADLPDKRMLAGYLREAMRLIDAGATSRSASASRAVHGSDEVPPDLAAALQQHAAARASFENSPAGQRREYIEWITGAKRAQTRQRRLSQAIEWLADGKPRNWKYMNR